MALNLNNSNFDLTITSNKLVLVDFWASWCGPCKILGPVIEEIYNEYDQTKAIIAKVDVDENQELATKYGIRNIPTILIFKNKQVVDKIIGVISKEEIIEKLNQHI